MEDTETIKTIGATWNNTYAFSEIVDGTMATEFGVYTSWECDAARPGFYRALLDMRLVAADGTREWRVGGGEGRGAMHAGARFTPFVAPLQLRCSQPGG